ncbi:MAG: flagellar biosynthesis protein FlhB [Turicibacter sp.]
MEIEFLLLIGFMGMTLIACLFSWTPQNNFIFNFDHLNWHDSQSPLFDGLMFFAANDGAEKSEKATPKKLEDAKKKGQVIKSSDVNNFITLIASMVLVITFGPIIIGQLKELLIYFLSNSSNTVLITQSSDFLFMESVGFYFTVIIFIMIPMLLAGVFANIIQTGFMFTTEPMKPTLDKINPLKGLKNMFSRKKLFDFIKNMLKLIIVTVISYLFVKARYVELLKLPYMGLSNSLVTLGDLTKGLITQVAILIGILAAFDYAFQRFEFLRELKMSKQEIKEEYKQMEGDPYIKGKRRQRQREMATGGMRKAVSEATVIVTNPTHFAIAIAYDHESEMIPKVVAKGVDFKAQKIKEIAKEHDVPVIENKPLARTLYKTVEVDQSIPMDLYKAVAQLLVIVYRLKNKK